MIIDNRLKSEEKAIVNYFKKRQGLRAVILHGSRATGNERAHSDWDIITLSERDKISAPGRALVGKQDIEWKDITIPWNKKIILKQVGPALQFAKLLWEEGHAGSDLLKFLAIEYRKGPHITKKEIDMRKQFFHHKILGLIDDQDHPYMFERHRSTIFDRATRAWYEVLHREYSKPLYMAEKDFKTADPLFFEAINIITGISHSNQKIISSALWIEDHIFKCDPA